MGLNASREINIDLSIAVADKEFNLSGNFFYVKEAPDSEVNIDVKVNSSGNNAISWTHQTGFVHPFNRIYITTPAGQTGTMKILIAAQAPDLFSVIDNRSAQGVLAELQGDTTPENWGWEITVNSTESILILALNENRKSCSIQSKSTNGGKVYIGYGNAVSPNEWIAELQAGQSYATDNYRGTLYARADTMGQRVGYGEH